MHITFFLTTTTLIGIGHAAMSADEITKCLSDITTQFTDLDAKAQRINLSTFIGLQNVRKNTTSPTRKSQLNPFVTPGHPLRLLRPHQPREGLRRPAEPGSRIPRLRHRATAADLRGVQIRKSTSEKTESLDNSVPATQSVRDKLTCAQQSALPHQSFFNYLIINKNTITAYGAAPVFSDLITEERKQHEAFSTGISNAVPECVQDVTEAKGAVDSKFDQIISALAA
jgi:hypothetical protein